MNVLCHHHHYFSAQGQALGFQILQFSQFSAFLFISPYVSSNTSLIMPILGLPLGLFPSILPSSTNFIRPYPLTTCPIQFFFLSHTVFIKLLFSLMELSICPFIHPANLSHSSPHPHFKGVKTIYLFFSHGPCLTSIHNYRPHKCFNQPLP